ncbi:F-box/FBD/LRR-repeat protein At1g13570-like [Lolium rigidum]|uniref:F-box/FBD/LRR-repeat protein At1g13570-like n=1 Tax=Lolium rigidum TaxID=89674 RepID=UPI001F5DE324|nr:F-box/FBD/LRR-repeat protein At1g13570-like [Lolium rigidum]XP_047042640.1 F-box/FBD/LRR-repeat protein At1g13570-like [Lolium rigidum]
MEHKIFLFEIVEHEISPAKICKSVADEDIITNLPDALKDKILCCLPIKEAVRTCLLSRNWRYTWASMTELVFRRSDFASGNGNAKYDACKFLKFTDMFLSLHNGPILKFGLNTGIEMLSTGGHIYRWMLMLSRNGIKEIHLMTSTFDRYKIPSCFFFCDRLEHVYLRACILTSSQLPLSKGFKQLSTLHLEHISVQGNSIGDLVASCPNLEKLHLAKLISMHHIYIHSTKLKILTIEGQFQHLNLHTPYLTSATIKLKLQSELNDASTARCNFNLSEFIGSLSDAETIILHGPILECVDHEFLILKTTGLFNRLTYISLEINLGNLKEANLALCLFQHAPNLTCIDLMLIPRNLMVTPVRFWESIDRHVCLFQKVHTVGMTNFTGSFAELGFLKLLLEDAPVLRKVIISDKGLDRGVFQNLLKMRRTSKEAEIVIV